MTNVDDPDRTNQHAASGDLRNWTRRLRKEPPAAVAFVEAIDAIALDSEVGFAAEHARRYIASEGQDDGWDGPRPILILYTTGRKSGNVRRNPLLFFAHAGERYVVGSKGGEDVDPDWYLNLVAQPRVHVRVMAEIYEARAETVSGPLREQLWPLLTAAYPMFADYQRRTTREIPIVRLVPIAG